MRTSKETRCRPRRWLVGLALVAAAGGALAGSANYTYDALGRLVQVAYANGVVITYTYDTAGNRTSMVVSGAP